MRTTACWSAGSARSVGSYLFRISPITAAYLAYDLHFEGVSDGSLAAHADWQLFGMTREDVIDELKKLSLRGLFIIQAAGEVVRISWKQPTMEAACNVID